MSAIKTGVLLLAHGSRDPEWRKPFDAILQQVRARGVQPVALGFLESMDPDFSAGVAELVSAGATHVHVVPLFLAAGGHVRRDLPLLAKQAEHQHPGISVSIGTPIGESLVLQNAIASHIQQTALLAVSSTISAVEIIPTESL